MRPDKKKHLVRVHTVSEKMVVKVEVEVVVTATEKEEKDEGETR